ncbi:MAG: S-methyl-5-thioribose-1-phosphate isomerase [Thermoplasmata archaeon]|nr:S-methyl-5-thioribose-1-phosphate isomerase [Thermoplasmata archaeon]
MNVEETALKIQDMTIRGAGRIARAAAAAMLDYAVKCKSMTLEEFLVGLDIAALRLISTRPTAISLSNAVSISIRGTKEQEDFNTARYLVISNAEKFIRNSNSAVEKIGQNALPLMKKPGKVITICNSSAAISAILECHKAGRITGVYACETRPKKQGLITIKELAKAGVPVTLIVDSAMRFVMPEVSIAFVGTDTLESDGSLINKIGTHLLAATARDFNIPIYACAETYKFLPASKIGQHVEIELRPSEEILPASELPANVKVFNPVFDRVPPELITGIITEVGIIKPEEAIRIIKEHLEDI